MEKRSKSCRKLVKLRPFKEGYKLTKCHSVPYFEGLPTVCFTTTFWAFTVIERQDRLLLLRKKIKFNKSVNTWPHLQTCPTRLPLFLVFLRSHIWKSLRQFFYLFGQKIEETTCYNCVKFQTKQVTIRGCPVRARPWSVKFTVKLL